MTGSTGKVEHQAIATQGCTSCHDPHSSSAKYLLVKGTLEQTCAQCHDTPHATHEHAPFAAGQCNLCHAPHVADNALLLRHGADPKLENEKGESPVGLARAKGHAQVVRMLET